MHRLAASSVLHKWLDWLSRRAGPRLAQLPVLVLLSGLGTTALVAELVRQAGVERHQRIESNLIEKVRLAVSNRLDVNIALLAAVKGLFETSATVSRKEFASFLQTVDSMGILRGIQGVGFSRAIPRSQLLSRERAIQAEGFASYHVHPTGERQFYSAIEMLEPFEWRNQRAFGFDMFSEPVRRAAMERAMRTGLPSLSGRVTLVQETKTAPQAGSLLYLPITKGTHFLGWAYSPLRLTDLIGTAIRSIDDPYLNSAEVAVFDGTRPEPGQLLFDNQRRPAEQLTHMRYSPVEMAGRTWLVGVELGSELVGPNGISEQFWWSLLAGTAASTMLSLSTWLLVRNQMATRRSLVLAEQTAMDRALASTVFDTSSLGIVVTDPKGVIVMANEAFSLLSGYNLAELQGRNINLLKSEKHDHSFYVEMWQSLLQQSCWQGSLWNRVRSGELQRHNLSINAVRDQAGRTIYYVGMLENITQRYMAEEAVRFQAFHDPLTGLGNRQLLMEQLQLSLAVAQRHNQRLGVLFIDLDGFKAVNDRHGHAVGDQVLKQVGQRFRTAIRQSDLLARIGGDEFVVLVTQVGDLQSLTTLAAKLVRAARKPLSDLQPPLAISASVGIACYPEHGGTAEDLLLAADQVMYAAKHVNRHAADASDATELSIRMASTEHGLNVNPEA